MQEQKQKALRRSVERQTLRTAAQANRAVRNAGQEVQNTAEPSREAPTDYAESTVKSAAQDTANMAGNVTLETARLSYTKFRAMQSKRQQTAATENIATESAAEAVEASKEAAKPALNAPNGHRKTIQRQQFQKQA